MNQDWVQEYWGQSIKAGVSDAIGELVMWYARGE